MKRFLLLTALVAQALTMMAAKLTIDRIDPTDWFVGMKNPRVQLMVYGKGIAAVSDVTTDYPGARIDSVVRLDSPNYLLVYMNLRDAQPGTMTLQFKAKSSKLKVDYRLKARTMKGEEQVYENMFGFLTEKACPREPEEEELEANRKPVLSAHINDPETAYIRKELRAQLKKALSKAKAELTDKQLEVYTLRYENGMTLEEIGEKLNIAVNAVVKRLNGIAKKYHAHIENIR